MNGFLASQGMIVLFIGGLSLFLYGIRIMSGGLKKVSGDRVRLLVSKVTGNRLYGLFSGAFASMTVQSSSTVMAILVGLVHSRMMQGSQAFAVILGAEIGTTAMAQLVAFRLHDYALLFFSAGFVLSTYGKKEATKMIGEVLAGFGLLFFGLKLMSTATVSLDSYEPLIAFLRYLGNPLLAFASGMLVTAFIHSSAAFIGIAITLAMQGSITLETGIAMLFGANIGTCVTAVFASSGMMRAARRVALAQVLFNVTGVLLFFPFLAAFADLVRWLTLAEGAASPGGFLSDIPRQIANAHTLFNVAMALIFLPLLPRFDRLVQRILPDDPRETGKIPASWFLKDAALSSPEIALRCARAELSRMGHIAAKIVKVSLYPFIHGDPGMDAVYRDLSVLEGMSMREEKLDYLDSRISDYLIRISRSELNEKETAETFALMNIVKEIESVGDVIESLTTKAAWKKWIPRSELSSDGRNELTELNLVVSRELEKLAGAISSMDTNAAKEVLDGDQRFGQLSREAEIAHLKRVCLLPEAESTHDLHMELINAYKQVHHYSKSIARNISGSSRNQY
ncbi:MAG: Na/Pi cotransporter family protein [Chlorobiaceae bacterium]|nr:Na/Pi cotransporter family protein [Chlorobiaceae bacterium]NTV60652.1 Na/Pi cotransporter family protein [Chlorobiaceae bacterium]